MIGNAIWSTHWIPFEPTIGNVTDFFDAVINIINLPNRATTVMKNLQIWNDQDPSNIGYDEIFFMKYVIYVVIRFRIIISVTIYQR